MDTQNELLNRLIAKLDPQYVNMVDVKKMQEYNFVPISFKDNYLFVCSMYTTDKELVANYLYETLQYRIKFIEIPKQDLKDLLNHITENKSIYTDKTIDDKSTNIEGDSDVSEFCKKLDGHNYFFQILLFEFLQYAAWSLEHTIRFSIWFSALLIILCTIKRLNDIKVSRWFAIFAFIPGVKYAFEICLAFIPATYNKNKENRNVFDPRGYLHRLNYFILITFCYALDIVTEYLPLFKNLSENSSPQEWLLVLFIFFIWLYITICTVIKRLNDINAPRWLAAFVLIPYVDVAFYLSLLLKPSRYKD